jgi:uncharacterized protein YaaW (UPF0174 family)
VEPKDEIAATSEPPVASINFKHSNNVPLQYANHAAVSIAEHEVVISFFQSAIAFERQTDGEQINRLLENGIDAECIARIVVSKSFYTLLAELLQRNLPKFDKEQLKEILTQLTADTENQ